MASLAFGKFYKTRGPAEQSVQDSFQYAHECKSCCAIVISPQPHRRSPQLSAFCSHPKGQLLDEAASAPRRGRHITAQGRDRRERTLGEVAHGNEP